MLTTNANGLAIVQGQREVYRLLYDASEQAI